MMVSDRLVTKTYKDITQTIRNQFFPRRLIQDRNRMSGFFQSIKDTLLQVNKIAYKPRFYELPVEGSHIDLTKILIPGVRPKKVLDLIPMTNNSTMFGLYEKMMYGQPIFFNLIRNQNNFIDYVFSREVFKQIEQRYQNRNNNFEFVGDKVILGQHWVGLSSQAVVVFIPSFKDTPNSEIAKTNETLGNLSTGTRYTFYIKEPFIKPSTVVLKYGAHTITDDGSSNLSGAGVRGTVNYANGEVILAFDSATTAQAITADYTQLEYSWEFSEKEWLFFSEYLEALVSAREGRAQSEMAIAEVPGNADVLMASDSKLETIIKKYKDTSFTRAGRKF